MFENNVEFVLHLFFHLNIYKTMWTCPRIQFRSRRSSQDDRYDSDGTRNFLVAGLPPSKADDSGNVYISVHFFQEEELLANVRTGACRVISQQ